MEQNNQVNKNGAEIKLDGEGESMIYNSKKNSKKKVLMLILVLIILAVAGFIYFSVLNKDSGKLPSEENTEIMESKEVDKNLDSDQDRLPDYLENILGTDANNPDTDGDGYDDLAEIKNGYSPLTSEKYTEDEWGNVRDVIKGEDRDFYEREFGVPAVSQISTPSSAPVVAKKCEYPEKIGEYSKQIVENIPLYDEKDKTKVTGQGLFFSYYLSNFNIINGLFFDLENEGEVKVRISDLLKNGGESCSIGNIAGVCVFKGDLVNKDENLGLDFIWTNGKTVKMAMTAFTLFSLTKEEVANLKGIEEINEKVKKNLIPFVAQFKDCNVK